MAPVLLNRRQLYKFGAAFVLVLVMVFMAGFLGGQYQANKLVSASADAPARPSEWEAQSAPPSQAPIQDQPASLVVAPEPQQTQPKLASIEIESNEDLLASAAEVDSADLIPVKAEQEPELEAKSDVDVYVEPTAAPTLLAMAQSDEMGSLQKSDKVPESPEFENEIGIADTSSADEALYTIQVGMFSSLFNAEQYVRELQQKQLSAYVSDYKNQGQQVRYNVRFGYFANRSSADQALQNYQQRMASSGYLVRLKP